MEARHVNCRPPSTNQGKPGGPVFWNTDVFSSLFSCALSPGLLPIPEHQGDPHTPLSAAPLKTPTAPHYLLSTDRLPSPMAPRPPTLCHCVLAFSFLALLPLSSYSLVYFLLSVCPHQTVSSMGTWTTSVYSLPGTQGPSQAYMACSRCSIRVQVNE